MTSELFRRIFLFRLLQFIQRWGFNKYLSEAFAVEKLETYFHEHYAQLEALSFGKHFNRVLLCNRLHIYTR